MKNKYSVHTHSFVIVVVLALFLAVVASACSPQPTAAQDDSAAVSADTVADESVAEEPTEEPTAIPPTATTAPTFTPIPTEALDQQGDDTSGTADTTTESTTAPAVIGTSTLTTLSNVNVRACPAVTCDIVGSFGGGATVNGLERVEGAAYGTSIWWWRVQLSGGVGYLHSTFVE